MTGLLPDIFYLLSSLSLRANFHRKALSYGAASVALFPEETRHYENYAYALLLTGQIQEASSVVAKAPALSANLHYLKSRIAIVLSDKSDGQKNLQKYLTFGIV
ncbi:hypothetical protein [Ochrobactrum sp. Marseille-Q0166]|uniref:tetratricopeptide repeat protein n=1 Tax=Ochrobactrum sp. Marseille-Q0166 TaxID=2761105 RepID=UPI0016565F5F|nr:hypothetical protein [Ochrobactrum sp. Marseille-Q0166]MBC8719579.1 hypothetical protein [Ochrobactrum sp. Marseille-Q0166]